jgi:hypothetical protein
MSYIGHEYHLEKSQLKDAFEAAKKNKNAFLIHYGTSTYDFCCVNEESTATAKEGQLDQALKDLYGREDTCFQSFYLIDIYDTSKAFNDAVQDKRNKQAETLMSELRYQDALDSRVFWKKWLNIEP